MAMESDTDRLNLLTALGDGKTATYKGGSISVLFRKAYTAVNPVTDEVETVAPEVDVRDSDVSGIAHGDTLVIDGTTYYVRGIHPDGTGLTMLVLSRD